MSLGDNGAILLWIPDNPSRTITEENYILRQGRVPLKKQRYP